MFQVDEIVIKTFKMSPKYQSKVMWIDIGEYEVRRVFHREKTLRNPIVQLINYIPPELWNKKKQLEIKLTAIKKSNPKVTSKAQYVFPKVISLALEPIRTSTVISSTDLLRGPFCPWRLIAGL